MTRNSRKIAFMGFGEAARAFAKGWADRDDVRFSAYDIKTDAGGAEAAAMRDAYAASGVGGCDTPGDALEGAEMVFSFVTADQAVRAAESAAPVLPAGALFCDCNSCSPQDKVASARAIEGAGGRYVDVAVMAPVHPGLHRTPLLISGAHADEAQDVFGDLDMQATLAEGPVGRASSIKLTRSIMVKGLEALMAECLAAARAADVVEPVLASLKVSHPGIDWDEFSTIGQERMALHGIRRAAEMRAAADMVARLDLPNDMARGTAEWEARIGGQGGGK